MRGLTISINQARSAHIELFLFLKHHCLCKLKRIRIVNHKYRGLKLYLDSRFQRIDFLHGTLHFPGICEDCGATPPSLQWMYPEGEPRRIIQYNSLTPRSESDMIIIPCISGPPGGDTRSGARRRRSGWLRSIRSSSSDRPMAIPNTVASAVAARR